MAQLKVFTRNQPSGQATAPDENKPLRRAHALGRGRRRTTLLRPRGGDHPPAREAVNLDQKLAEMAARFCGVPKIFLRVMSRVIAVIGPFLNPRRMIEHYAKSAHRIGYQTPESIGRPRFLRMGCVALPRDPGQPVLPQGVVAFLE